MEVVFSEFNKDVNFLFSLALVRAIVPSAAKRFRGNFALPSAPGLMKPIQPLPFCVVGELGSTPAYSVFLRQGPLDFLVW